MNQLTPIAAKLANKKETAVENKYSIQIKCFQTIDVDGIEDKPELFGDPISGGFRSTLCVEIQGGFAMGGYTKSQLEALIEHIHAFEPK